MKNRYTPHNEQQQRIPDLDIIDLEQEDNPESLSPEDSQDTRNPDESSEPAADGGKKKGVLSHINIHIVLLAVTLLFVAGIVYKIMNFGVRIDLDEIFADGSGTYEDTFDTILPLIDASNNPVYKDYSQGATILAFGNAPFADDRDSEDNLVNLMAKETGTTIYNCSISGSTLAAADSRLDVTANPWDVFTLYWMCVAASGNEEVLADYLAALDQLGDDAPPEAREVYDIMQSVDMSDVDVVVAMYDASDYLAANKMFNDDDYTDVSSFTGNTEAAIEHLQFYFPDVRIIILSPTYAYGLEEDGSYVSSDIKRYGNKDTVLSTYVIRQYASCVSRSVTFVDNLYGTITEDNADEYLTDHLHLNLDGRKKVAQRFAYALNYYNQQTTDPE